MTRVFFLTLLLPFVGAGVSSAELSYDRYASLYEDREEPSTAKIIATDFLSYPFELIRWPVDRVLYTIEEHHLHKKVQWLYETMQNHGVTPSLSVTSLDNFGGGARFDFIRIARQKQNFPDATLRGWVKWVNDVRFNAGVKGGWERIAETNFRAFGTFDYEERPEEHFYGIGPDSSTGEGSIFRKETTTTGLSVGYSPDPTWSADLVSAFHNVNITGASDGGRAQPGAIPSFGLDTPGISGDTLYSIGAEFVHDSRNQKDNSMSGGKRSLGWTYYEGLNSSDARYVKYEMDVSQYFRLGSDRRVFVARVYGEHNDEIGNGSVPFHQMAKLGGHGRRGNRLSETLRGYAFNRFFDESAILFNLEYRYTVWEYRQFKGDAVIFWDEGQVFGEFSEFQFKDFRESYGVGLRFSVANITLVSLEVAHGDEGTNFFVKSHAPF